MPVRGPGRHVLALEIMVLMAGAAFQAGDTLAFATTPNVHRMLVSVIALPGKVSAGMAIHATLMPQHRHDGCKCGCRRGPIACRGSRGMLPVFPLRNRLERPLAGQDAGCERKRQSQCKPKSAHSLPRGCAERPTRAQP